MVNISYRTMPKDHLKQIIVKTHRFPEWLLNEILIRILSEKESENQEHWLTPSPLPTATALTISILLLESTAGAWFSEVVHKDNLLSTTPV